MKPFAVQMVYTDQPCTEARVCTGLVPCAACTCTGPAPAHCMWDSWLVGSAGLVQVCVAKHLLWNSSVHWIWSTGLVCGHDLCWSWMQPTGLVWCGCPTQCTLWTSPTCRAWGLSETHGQHRGSGDLACSPEQPYLWHPCLKKDGLTLLQTFWIRVICSLFDAHLSLLVLQCLSVADPPLC